jgi:hypothetical protein
LKRILSLVASLGLVALMLGGTAATVLAWTPPTITPICSDTTGLYNWTITLASGESNYNYQISPDGTTWSANLAGSAGANSQTTGSQVLYVRWASDTNSKTGPVTNNAGRCTPLVPPDLIQTCGTLGFTSTDSDWSLIVEPGDYLVASGSPVTLDPGTYTYEFRYNGNDVSGGPVTITGCTGTLTFVKFINGLNAAQQGPAHPDQFSFTYSGDSSGVVSIPNGKWSNVKTLPFGTYTVGEVVGYYLEHGYFLLATACGPLGATESLGNTVTLSADHPNMECIFTNQYTPTVVHWFKIVQGGGPAVASDFTMTLTGPQSENPLTMSGKNGDVSTASGWGQYTLTESGPAHYVASLGGCSTNPTTSESWGDSSQTMTPFLRGGEVWYCGFVNTYVPPTTPVSPPCTSANGCFFNTPTPSVSPTPSASVSPTPSVTPSSSPTPSAKPTPITTPKITLPPTSTGGTGSPGDPSAALYLVIAVLAIGSAGTLLLARSR